METSYRLAELLPTHCVVVGGLKAASHGTNKDICYREARAHECLIESGLERVSLGEAVPVGDEDVLENDVTTKLSYQIDMKLTFPPCEWQLYLE